MKAVNECHAPACDRAIPSHRTAFCSDACMDAFHLDAQRRGRVPTIPGPQPEGWSPYPWSGS